jgi:hypothetical protein
MAALNDRQVDRFVQLGSTNATGAASALAASVTGPGTGADVLKVAYDFGSTTAAVGGNTPYGQAVGTPVTVTDPKTGITTTTTMISDGRGGSFPQVTTGASSADITATSATQDAFALLEATFNQYGLESLAPLIKGYMQQNMGPNQAALLLKQTPEYKARFAGNETRKAAGLNMLSEAEYLALENSYTNLFGSYGVKNLANRTQFAGLIGNDVSSTELNSRLDLAVNQVQNADPTVVSTLKQFYPSISNQDLVSYFLAPGETLPQLQMQVQSADIGAAATQQGLATSQSSAEALAKYGVTYGQAQVGYGKIAEALPATQKLSQIYNAQTGINYNQTEAEAQYLKNSGAATLEQQKLKDLESAQFQGRSGVLGANVAAGYSGSLGKSIQGSF